MIPVRSAIRSGPYRRCRPSTLSPLSTPSPRASLSTVARPLGTAQAAPSSRALPLAIRSLHSTSLLGKDNKRWVNSAESPNGKNAEDGEGSSEVSEMTEKAVDGAEEAESSKAAEKRANAQIDAAGEASAEVKASASGSSSSASSSSAPPAAASSAGSGSGSDSSSSPSPDSTPKTGKEIAKPSIPEFYPQVLALPITRRPLFPGFYKAVTITSPSVIKAIRELLAHGQPYIGAFLLKDSASDSDVITSMDQVHPVGVFAQITSVFGSAEANKGGEGGESKPETLTAVLYPHRRIRIDELVTQIPAPSGEPLKLADVVDAVHRQETEEDVPSFEKGVPSVEEVKEDLGSAAESKEQSGELSG